MSTKGDLSGILFNWSFIPIQEYIIRSGGRKNYHKDVVHVEEALLWGNGRVQHSPCASKDHRMPIRNYIKINTFLGEN